MARPFGTKKIETPERLWDLFQLYKKEVKSNPILVQDFVGKDGYEVNRKKEIPLTIEGFEIYCWENDFINDLSDYFANKDKRYEDYTTICSRIRKEVRNDQIKGGMAGIYNPSITQRLNGLVEKSDNNSTGEISITVKYAKRDNDNAE